MYEGDYVITPDQIGWGKYLEYEGPYYRGNQPYVLPQNPTPEEIYLATITATEGGSYNAINMYDRCGVSLGVIQWCEFGQFSVSSLLGECLADGRVNYKLHEFLAELNASLVRTGFQNWRFTTQKDGNIDTIDKQRDFFFLNARGTLGSWDDDSKAYAKRWASILATMFEDDLTKEYQLTYTLARLDKFVLPGARGLNPRSMAHGEKLNDWANAGYAAYLSFAANNPLMAFKMFQEHSKEHGFRPTDKDWVIGLLKQLTFGPKFTIYPERYNKIRPVLEKNFAVDLPDFSYELYRWQQMAGIDPADPPEYRLDSTLEVQKALLTLGFDLGPAGADGKFGPKTRQAVITFQGQHQLTPDGIVGPSTRSALAGALQHRGI